MRPSLSSVAVLAVAVLGLAGCDVFRDDVDAGYCVDCDRLPVDSPTLTLFPELPEGQQGCPTGQRATWIVLQVTPDRLGKLDCVPSSFGTVPLGGGCTLGSPGETTGFDDCAAGGICSEAVCRDICRLDAANGSPGGCATGTCTIDPLLFANGAERPAYGACR